MSPVRSPDTVSWHCRPSSGCWEKRRGRRAEINGTLSAASQAVEEIFERASSESKAATVRLTGEIDRLARLVSDAADWRSTFALIANHKQQSAAVRDGQLSITDRKELRSRLEAIWKDIAEKLQEFRFGRAAENIDATMRRLEQQGWLLFVNDVPRIA
jgi:polyribonucleotide nucleotidyltransferase